MKKWIKTAALISCCALISASLAGCGTTIVEDPNAYTFTNPERPQAQTDADMTIDGVFDEARWDEVRWLYAVDRINAVQYADISFTTSYGKQGVYFAMRVEEHGTNIYVNHDRGSVMNSCIEMYMGPATDPGGSRRLFEFDFQADGTYSSRLNYNGWNDAKTTWDKMPVVASQTLGGEVNTPECYGYTVEALFPWTFLEFAGYDVATQEERDSLVLGIDPAHIFSFNYEGTDQSNDRFWSMWSTDYIGSLWLNPSTFFKFDKNGLIAYDYTVEYGGVGTGTLQEIHGLPYMLVDNAVTFTVTTLNGASITALTVNGENYLDSLVLSSGVYQFSIGVPTEDVEIYIELN